MIYFDNAATTFPKPETVYKKMDSFYRQYGVNVGRGQHNLANEASKLVQSTREKIKNLFNCKSEHEVVFTPSATESINIILQGITWEYGETVYISHFEHNGVLRTLNHLKNKYQLKIEYIPVDKETLTYDIEETKYKFQDIKPGKLILNHASNVCGLIAPIKELSQLAKQYDAIVIVDCAQTAGLIDIDLKHLDINFLIFAGHKTLYGPFGIAGFVMERQEKINPLLFGGTGVDSLSLDVPTKVPDRFEVGSLNIHAISGLNASLDFINEIGIQNIRSKERELTKALLDTLKSKKGIKIYAPSKIDNQIGIISFNIKNYPADIIGNLLNNLGIAVRTGLQCAPEAHKFLGTNPNGTVRVGLSYFNNMKEVEFLNSALNEIILEI